MTDGWWQTHRQSAARAAKCGAYNMGKTHTRICRVRATRNTSAKCKDFPSAGFLMTGKSCKQSQFLSESISGSLRCRKYRFDSGASFGPNALVQRREHCQ